jgi:ribose transport system substrate-binding protein
MTKGLYQADVDLKVNGDWQAPDPTNNAAQVKVIQDAVAAKTDGLAISVIEADALVSTINDAIKQGIPVITFDSDSEKSNRLCYLGTVNFEAGRQAGLAALKLFPTGGKLVAFVGNMSAQNARDRYNGFKEAIKGSKLEFLRDPYTDEKSASTARKNVEDALTKYGSQVTGLVGLYSYNGPAIVNAVMAQNLRDKMKIICFDGEPETLSNLKKGLVDVTVVQKPYEFGRLSIMLLDLLHKGKNIDAALTEMQPELDKLGMKVDKAKHTIDTGVEVVTPANSEQFLDKLKKLGLTST